MDFYQVRAEKDGKVITLGIGVKEGESPLGRAMLVLGPAWQGGQIDVRWIKPPKLVRSFWSWVHDR